jgi:hypothetical protein
MCSIDSLFGGPSTQEKGSLAQADTLADSFQGDFNTVFGEQQSTLANLKNELTRIDTGHTGMGFSAEQNALLMSGIETGAAGAERNTEQAAQNKMAGLNQTGGVASGAQAAREAGIIAGGEEAKAQGLNAETLANINQGRQNAMTTAGGLQSLAGLENPEGYGKLAGNENQAAFQQANIVNQQHQAAVGSFMKGITGMAGVASDMFGGPIAGMANKMLSGASDVMSGGGGAGGAAGEGGAPAYSSVNFGS